MVAVPSGMNNLRLDRLLRARYGSIEGEVGFWKIPLGDFQMFVITDESHDRMRIMIPVHQIDPDDAELAQTLLAANFDRALDAKYAIHDGIVWSTFLHRLHSLTESELDNALDQVPRLAENTGTTYSSSSLTFGGADE